MSDEQKAIITPLGTPLQKLIQEQVKQFSTLVEKELISIQRDMENLVHVIRNS